MLRSRYFNNNGINAKMPSPKYKLEVVTPNGVVFDREVTSVIAPGATGKFGVLANHAPFMTSLQIGSLEATDESGTFNFSLSGGFAEILPKKTTILAETAELKQSIDVERAKSSMERAKERISKLDGDTDISRAQASLARAINRLRVAGVK
jgi:F-type H+-transporting ATPase subunit epsilon